jgi:hypothetical protein
MSNKPIPFPKPPGLPKQFEKYFSAHKPCLLDSSCSEPIGWGYELTWPERLSPELFDEIGMYGVWDARPRDPQEFFGKPCPSVAQWFLITKYLSLDEAQRVYGENVTYERGPRGGFRSMTVGKMRFNIELLPESYAEEEKNRELREEAESRTAALDGLLPGGKRLIQEVWEEENRLRHANLPVEEFPRRYRRLEERELLLHAFYGTPFYFRAVDGRTKKTS